MPRNKANDQESLLSKPIIVRVTESEFNRFEKLRKESELKTIGEIVRKILAGQKVKIVHQDTSLNKPMEEMALIRKELRAIGVNINQITRHFNQDPSDMKRAFYSLKASEEYAKVTPKVEELLSLISKLAAVWLPK